jgi:hypothetical protein
MIWWSTIIINTQKKTKEKHVQFWMQLSINWQNYKSLFCLKTYELNIYKHCTWRSATAMKTLVQEMVLKNLLCSFFLLISFICTSIRISSDFLIYIYFIFQRMTLKNIMEFITYIHSHVIQSISMITTIPSSCFIRIPVISLNN